MFLNWLLRWIIVGFFVRIVFPIKVEGRKNLPGRGGAIIAIGPHRTESESIKLASYLPRRQLVFFAKQEYWDKHKWLGRLMTAIGLLPLPRRAGHAVVQQIKLGVDVVNGGRLLAMYPEGTRGHENTPTMHRGYTGVARISLQSGGKPIIPVALIGMREARPFQRGARIVIGAPIYPFAALSDPQHHQLTEKVLERMLVKPLTLQLSREIAHLAGDIPYVDTERPIPDS